MTRLNLEVRPGQYEELRAQAKMEGVTISALVRRLVGGYLSETLEERLRAGAVDGEKDAEVDGSAKRVRND